MPPKLQAGLTMPPKLLGVYVIQVASTIDNVLVNPTLVHYLRELCGGGRCDAMAAYGRCQCVFFASRVVAMWFVGRAIDGDAGGGVHGRAATACLAAAAVGSAAYALAPTVEVVVAARALAGASSSVVVATTAYVSARVPARDRTPVFSTIMGLQRLTSLCGPAVLLGLRDRSYAGAGAVVAACNVAALATASLDDAAPDRAPDAKPRRADAPRGARAVARTLVRSGAWACFFLSWNNNFGNQTLDWSLPLVTSRLFGPSALRDSALFAVTGVVGTASAFAVGPLARRYELGDRGLCVGNQVAVGAVLFAYAALFGCPSLLGPAAPRPLGLFATVYALYHVPFLAQMPSNNSIYTKLVAREQDAGFYLALMEIFKGLARAAAGYAVGALAADDPCRLWLFVFAMFALQFVPVAISWDELGAVDKHPVEMPSGGRQPSPTPRSRRRPVSPEGSPSPAATEGPTEPP
jgi:hypothetical protein